MPLSYAELEQFYEGLVSRARNRGVTCAITSGMACVAFGVAQATKDCDLLCAPEAAERLFTLLCETNFAGLLPHYRGKLSPPLDARWLRGGWTSHFVWEGREDQAYLEIFGVAPRGSEPWETDLRGFYASPHTVAEMKRTDRGKDWPFVTAIGAKLLESRDPRGWLHIYDEDLLRKIEAEADISPELLRRPVLRLAAANDPRLRAALHAEIQFWHELDRARLRIYERALRPYGAAVRRAKVSATANLRTHHEVRVHCAEQYLPLNPLRDHGFDRMLADAREALIPLIHPAALEWLPDVREHFRMLL